jgi:large subunit ribosomal protein L18
LGQGARYRVAFRRRRQNRTDYRMRRTMIISDIPRLVVRSSLRNLGDQLIEASAGGDKVLTAAGSKDLEAYGWQAPSGNIPAAYLTGYLLGKKAQAAGVKEAILDIGLKSTTLGSRIFAALKGAVDSGLSVPCSEDILPSEERMRGEHIAAYAKQLAKADQALYNRAFSKYLSKDLRPEELTLHLDRAKEKIDASFKEEK